MVFFQDRGRIDNDLLLGLLVWTTPYRIKNQIKEILILEKRFVMKKIVIVVLVISFVTLTYTYMQYVPIPIKNLPVSVNMIVLPSPPHYKTISDTENIKLIFKMINDSDLKPMINNEKGWQVRLEYKGGSVAIIENKIQINGKWFKSNNNISSMFKDFYLNLDYKEELWK